MLLRIESLMLVIEAITLIENVIKRIKHFSVFVMMFGELNAGIGLSV